MKGRLTAMKVIMFIVFIGQYLIFQKFGIENKSKYKRQFPILMILSALFTDIVITYIQPIQLLSTHYNMNNDEKTIVEIVSLIAIGYTVYFCITMLWKLIHKENVEK